MALVHRFHCICLIFTDDLRHYSLITHSVCHPHTDTVVVVAVSAAGVLYICVHSAQNLLAADRNGTSDPYCVIFSNGKKVIYEMSLLSPFIFELYAFIF